jgi:hypothetical protein
LRLNLHPPDLCLCVSRCIFQVHHDIEYLSLSHHLLIGERDSDMGEKPQNVPLSVLHVLDLECHPIQEDFEPLVIIPDNLSFLLLDLLDFSQCIGTLNSNFETPEADPS